MNSRDLGAMLTSGTLLIRRGSNAGSGVLVGDKALTACHVVDGPGDLSAGVGQDRSAIRFIAASPAYDIAILEVLDLHALRDVPRFRPSSGGHVGDTVWTCGYPYTKRVPVVRRGTIAATLTPQVATIVDRPMFMDPAVLSQRHWIDVPVFPGNSGGPVIDEDGELLGLMLRTHFFETEDGPIHLDLGTAVRLGMGLAFTGLDAYL